MFAKRLILALLISFFLEITLFNYTHYATLFTNKAFGVIYSEKEQDFISNLPDLLELNRVIVKDSFFIPSPNSSLKFKNLNAEIASIYVNPVFLPNKNIQHVMVSWADEESSERSIYVSIIKGLDFSNYININPCGKVSELTVAFLESNLAIKTIGLNKTIPIAFMPIRFVIIGTVLLLLFCLKNEKYRKKISYFCFDYLYDKNNRWQKIGFAAFICFAIIFNFLVSYSVYGFKDNELAAEWVKMYSHHMTDAFLKSQLHLDIEVPKALIEAERPYDPKYRNLHGMVINHNKKSMDNDKNSLLGDRTYYDGKFYSYFGVVPAAMLFVPYKLVTGHYLPSTFGAFLFASLATILLLLLWKQIAQSYLNKIPYFFFLTSGVVLYACSFIPIILVENRFHTIAQFSALAFVILGVLCLLPKKQRLPLYLIFFGCLCFALAVGCRPSAIFWSLLVPVLLWNKRRDILNIKGLSAIIIPFAAVGSVLAWYNYARFGSPFIFGSGYMITGANQMAFPSLMNPIGKLHMVIKTFLFVLFNPPSIDVTFPFVDWKISTMRMPKSSFMYDKEVIIGIFCFPVMWFLFFIGKVKILRDFIFAGISISLLSVLIFALTGGIVFRYSMDFSWILGLCSLVCTFCLFERHREQMQGRIVLKAYYIFGSITVIFVFFAVLSNRLGFGSIVPLDPKIWYYLARTFGVICNIP